MVALEGMVVPGWEHEGGGFWGTDNGYIDICWLLHRCVRFVKFLMCILMFYTFFCVYVIL